MILEKLTPAKVNAAVEIYLRHAYDTPEKRESHSVHFPEDISLEDMLAKFEDDTDARPDAQHAYVLRLGSEQFPYMKFAVWEAYYHGEYVFSVDCHDGYEIGRNAPDYNEWAVLRQKNRELKIAIENDWFESGLPTMRSLRDSALSRTDMIRRFRGQEILIVDDDPDGSAITQVLLNTVGYHCHVERSIERAVEYLKSPDNECGMALVDIVLSDGMGTDFVATLKENPATSSIPVIVTSALRRDSVTLQKGALYLRKPFSAKELTDAIEEQVCRGMPGRKDILGD